jgi:hypothetical protein
MQRRETLEGTFFDESKVRIRKPVVTYDPGKFSVTERSILPHYFEIKELHNF